MPYFRFKLGDLVVFKTAIASSLMKCRAAWLALPEVGMIVERLSQECPGGLQLKYVVSINKEVGTVFEIELMSYAEYDLGECLDAYAASKMMKPIP